MCRARDVRNADYRSSLTRVSVAADELVIAFIAPPWGAALDQTNGLDLLRTTPPITEIVDFLLGVFAPNRLLCVIQVYERVNPVGLAEVTSRFDWSARRVYDLKRAGRKPRPSPWYQGMGPGRKSV